MIIPQLINIKEAGLKTNQGFLAVFEFGAEFFETLFKLVFYYVLAFY